METDTDIHVQIPTQVCGCPIDRVLTPGQSYLGIGPGGRGVVLKKVDPDCLVQDQLHPHVRDRLGRVRELAHPGVANLFGVSREGNDAYLSWEYVQGLTFDEFAAAQGRSSRDLAAAARELALSVDMLHMQGIVHGALIANNIFVSKAGGIRLTHISPLLYTDLAVDVECVLNVLSHAADVAGPAGAALATVVAQARKCDTSMRQLGARLGALLGVRDASTRKLIASGAPNGERRRALVGAAIVAFVGLVVAWSMWRSVEGGRFSLPDSLRLPFHTHDAVPQ